MTRKQMKTHLAVLKARIRTMTETEATEFLENEDYIMAQHCFNEVFGHYIN